MVISVSKWWKIWRYRIRGWNELLGREHSFRATSEASSYPGFLQHLRPLYCYPCLNSKGLFDSSLSCSKYMWVQICSESLLWSEGHLPPSTRIVFTPDCTKRPYGWSFEPRNTPDVWSIMCSPHGNRNRKFTEKVKQFLFWDEATRCHSFQLTRPFQGG